VRPLQLTALDYLAAAGAGGAAGAINARAALAGGLCGSVLFVTISNRAFRIAIPYVIVLSCMLLLPRIALGTDSARLPHRMRALDPVGGRARRGGRSRRARARLTAHWNDRLQTDPGDGGFGRGCVLSLLRRGPMANGGGHGCRRLRPVNEGPPAP
jgi:hypothetical protein